VKTDASSSTCEIVQLTPAALAKLFSMRQGEADDTSLSRRKVPRWPFNGTVEFWVLQDDPEGDWDESYLLGSCENMSTQGVGVRCDEPLKVGTELAIAVHQPELSMYGNACVRHCTRMHDDYFVGLEFAFDI